jgi:hypothetical protein
LEIGRRSRAHRTVLLAFISSVHNPKVMLGMLVKIFCRYSIATRRRLPREVNVALENLMGRASDFDVRTVTIETLTSLRHLLSIAVGIITIIPTIRSVGLSCSHDTFCIDGEVGWLSQGNVSEHVLQSDALRTAPAFSPRHVRWGSRYFQQFFGAMPAEAGLLGTASLLKPAQPDSAWARKGKLSSIR